jgi:alpha-aminoadipate carrier protein LysW
LVGKIRKDHIATFTKGVNIMKIVECISCGADIEIQDNLVVLGNMISCPHCDAELEVVWLDPLELDWPYEDDDEEDYYEEDDD